MAGTIVCVALGIILVQSGPPATPADPPTKSNAEVKLLCSFEKEELEKKGYKVAPWTTAGEFVVTGVSANVSGRHKNLLRKQHVTGGQWAACEQYRRGGVMPVDYPDSFPVEPVGKESEQYASFRHMLKMPADKLTGGGDWSGFDFLCLDVFSVDGDFWVRMTVEDVANTAPYARFHITKGVATTIAMPIGSYTDPKRADHINLKNIVMVRLHLEAAMADKGEIYLDNLRLTHTAPAEAMAPCQEIDRDWGWSKIARQHAPLTQPELVREAGPCEKIGPLTLAIGAATGYLADNDKLRDFTAVAAVDNKRLLVLGHFGGKTNRAGALASCDGGKTWGNIEGTGTEPSLTVNGGIGHGAATDYMTGNVYFANSTVPIRPKGFAADDLALPEGPECFKRFAFVNSQCHYAIRTIGLACLTLKDGHWRRVGPVDAPMTIFDDFTNHCPGGFDLIRLASGRLWSFLDHNGHAIRGVGVRASYSDDNGLTWAVSHRTRWIGPPGSYMRPFYVAPYKDQVAMIAGVAGGTSGSWTFFDGKEWAAVQSIEQGKVRDVFALACWPKQTDKLYAIVNRQSKLTLGRLINGAWSTLTSDPVLDDGGKGRFSCPRLTVSGDTLFCFWVRDLPKGRDGTARSNIILRRYDLETGQLAAEEEVASEQELIQRISAPHVCPPDYVALVWANSGQAPTKWLRFIKIPKSAKH